jgi:hypothetical protein
MAKVGTYDFGGVATKANVLCSDGRKIAKDAFQENYGKKVPLVWAHGHDSPENVLGHAMLEGRDGDVYAWCKFNQTPAGAHSREIVKHGDVEALSIWANRLVEKNKIVHEGVIREVSLVLSGANPGAKIDFINFAHGEDGIVDDEAIIYYDAKDFSLEFEHADTAPDAAPAKTEASGETVGDVLNTLDEKQKTVVAALIANLLGEAAGGDVQQADKDSTDTNFEEEGDKVMKKNVFNNEEGDKEPKRKTLTHDQFKTIVEDAKKTGSFREAFLAHAGEYGIGNIDYLFPDAKAVGAPEFVKRDMGWVSRFFNATRKTPFSRIKSLSADITVETARALGYVKGALKKEEYFAMAKRTTGPTTVYKKQKLDRDDIVDITDMDVVNWLKAEMRLMLDEEIARAGLIGDGRAAESEDKIDETCIRPIWKEASLYVHNVELESTVSALDMIDAIAAARSEYKGTGNPVMFCTPATLTSMLLLRDSLDHRLYRTVGELAAELRVSDIVEVPLMDGCERTLGSGQTERDVDLVAIIVNPSDYVFGADKGGSVNMFDDFDIDYNQYKYLIETRCSGALVSPKTAIVVEKKQAQA